MSRFIQNHVKSTISPTSAQVFPNKASLLREKERTMRQKRALSQLGQIFTLTTLLMWLVYEMFTCRNKCSDPCQHG